MKDHFVLIVEDESMSLKLLAQIVRHEGYIPILADSAELGVEILRLNKIGAIICDHNLPGMSGKEFVHQLKASSKNQKIPVLVASAYVKIAEIAEIIEAGADAFLPKPLKRSDVSEYLKRAFHA